MEEVKKRSKNFYLIVLQHIRQGSNPAEISKNLKITKQQLNYYISTLKKLGCIEKIGYGTWKYVKDLDIKEVKKRSKKNSSMGVRDKKRDLTDIHTLNIKFPIISGKLHDKDWEVKNKLNNWLPKYKEFDNFEGLTIRNNNNKSINIWLKPRKVDIIKDPYFVEKLAFKVKSYFFEYFKNKHNVILDVMEAETKNVHLETQSQEMLEGKMKKGELTIFHLGRKASKIFPKDNRDAEVHFDNSPDPFMAGTNDTEWKREFAFMPIFVREIRESMPLLAEYNKNLKLHLEVQQEQLKNQKEMNKLLKESRTPNIYIEDSTGKIWKFPNKK